MELMDATHFLSSFFHLNNKQLGADFFKTISSFNSIALKTSLEKIIFEKEWSFGKTLGLLRLAMVGELSGPDLFSLMQELKKEACTKRIAALLEVLKT